MASRMLGGGILLAAALVQIGGCSPAADDGPGGVVRDTLPGGVVRVTGPAEGLWGPEATPVLRERTRVGTATEEGPELFGNVWDVELDEMGRLWVLDRLAKEVRLFDRDGTFVRAIGREGEGPGEFSNPFGLAWSGGGNLWVVDVRLRRYSVFDTAGTHLSEYRRSVGGFSWPWPGRFDDSGTLFEASLTSSGTALMAFSPQGELVTTDSFPSALSTPDVGDFWNLRNEQGFGAVVPVPFGRQTDWALAGDRSLWMGTTDAYTIAKRSLRGDTLFVLERSFDPVGVSAEERAREIEDLGDFVDHPKMDLSRIPDHKPYFRRLIVDERNRLWVLREGAGDRWSFDVFREDGAYLGAVDLPAVPSLYPHPLVRGSSVVVVVRDELDVQYVVLYEMTTP